MYVIKEIKRLNLETPYLLWYLFPAEKGHDFNKLEQFLIKQSNGIGPSYLPRLIRSLLTLHFSTFKLAAIIHDAHYSIVPKTIEEFKFANKMFYNNCLILADHEPNFIKRKYYRMQALIMYQVVVKFGWRAFIEAC